MNQLIGWTRRYWWLLLAAVVLTWWIGGGRIQRNWMGMGYGLDTGVGGSVAPGFPMMVQRGAEIQPVSSMMFPIVDQGISQSKDRLVIQENSVSLLVADVNESVGRIQGLAESKGGFLVSKNVDRPEEIATGVIAVRVPSDKVAEMLAGLEELAVKVVSESVYGDDVTAQYEDIDAKLTVILKTKTKLEELLEQAVGVQDILEVQRELNNLQYQIDALQGQKDYLSKAAELTKITVYLSTDELALPYAPDTAWRPEVVFKQAVRELVRSLRQIGGGLIWVVVYSPIWLGLLLVGWLIKRKVK